MDLNQIPDETLQKLTDADLNALSNGNVEGLSKSGFILVDRALNPPSSQPVQTKDDVPEWGKNNPNLYAATMTALDTIPAVASVAGKAKVGIPIAAGLSAAAGGVKRAIEGKPQNVENFVFDAAKGAGVEGLGRGVGSLAQFALNAPAVRGGVNKVAEKLYESAMKFSTSPNILTPMERKAIVRTGLRDGYMPNEASYLRLRNNVDANTNEVNRIINQATEAGDTIPAEMVIEKGGLADLLIRGEQVRGVSPDYTNAINRTAETFKKGERVQMPQEFIPDPLYGNMAGRRYTTPNEPKVTTPYTPKDINASKKQIYQELEDAYGQKTMSEPGVQGKKQLASGMKTVLENLYPEIAKVNANSKELLDLSDHLARSIGRVGNRDIIGLGDKIVMDTIAAIPQEQNLGQKTLYGAVMAAIDRPIVKAKLAQVLYKANTGQNLPLSQWKKGAQYIGKAMNSAPARAAMESYILTGNDPLGIRQ